MSDFVRRYIAHNWALKLLALGSAIMLWVAVAREPRAEIAHTVPVEFINVPAGLAINSDKVPEVQLWLSGPERIVRGVAPQDLHPVIDLSAMHHAAAERTFSLGKSQIKAPHGVEIVEVVPSEFHLSFDEMLSREVPVRPRVTHEGDSFRLVSAVCDPAQVTLQGPRSRVAAIEEATTDAIDASGVRGRQTFTTTPYVNDPLVRVLQPAVVHVVVTTERTSGAGGGSR